MPFLRFVIGILIGAITIYWLFRGTDWHAIILTIDSAEANKILVGLVFMIASQLTRAIRWYVIIKESFPTRFSAVYMSGQLGLLINFLIPARLGELIRAYLLAKENQVSVAQCLGTIMIDKSFDLIIMLLAIVLLSFIISSHGELSIPAFLAGTQNTVTISNAVVDYGVIMIGVMLAVLIILLVLVYLKYSIVNKYILHILFFLPDQWKGKLTNAIERTADGLHILNSTKSLLMALLWSFIIWVFSYLAIYFIISALRDTSLITPFIVLVLVAVFISIPIVPGVVGQYHIAVIIGLLFLNPDMPKEKLISIALITHFMTLFTTVSLGAGALLRAHTSFLSVLSTISKSKRV